MLKLILTRLLKISLTLMMTVSAVPANAGTLSAQNPELDACVSKCVEALDAAEEYQTELRKEVELYKGLTLSQQNSIEHLRGELKNAEAWYRSPEFVAPVTVLLTILLIVPSMKGYK